MRRLARRSSFAVIWQNQTSVVPPSPYSPDLVPANFFLFPKLKTILKGRRFQTIEEIKENAKR